MEKITGEKLFKLGFEKTIASPDGLDETNFHYYTYGIGIHTLLITCANDEKVNGGYTVEFYDLPELKFYDFQDLKKQFEIINKLNNL